MTGKAHCFLCGIPFDPQSFNEEHVIPNWVQRACDLSTKEMTLPNGTRIRYPQYKIPCCIECNSYLANWLEKPIAQEFYKGPDSFSEYFATGGAWKIFLWMNLIFLKVHLKDLYLREDQDRRNPAGMLGDSYPWEELHHSHALLRAEKFGVKIADTTVLGSMMCLHLGNWTESEKFDYNDHLPSKTVHLRINDIALICVLDDACGTLNGLDGHLDNLPTNLSAIQMAELISEFQFVSLHLKYRPSYYTRVDASTGIAEIISEMPEIFELNKLNMKIRGELMYRNIAAIFGKFKLPGLSHDETANIIKNGEVSFMGETADG